MEKLLVSSCLLGNNTKYNGGNNYIPIIEELKNKYELIPICPEFDGGLPIPRDPSERILDKVVSNKGIDVTKEYTLGAKIALKKALDNNITKALLKDGSPSCGSKYIYDGTFSHNRIDSMGVTAELLEKNGIKVYSESEINELL